MSKTFLSRLGLSLVAAATFGLLTVGVGGAADGGPLVIGAQNLGTAGGNITQLRAITNGPAFYATNEWGNGISAIAYPPYGIGVYGIHQATTGSTPGVMGETASTGGDGVFGENTSVNGGYGVAGHGWGGVSGAANGTFGNGVYGFEPGASGNGVYGKAGSTSSTAYAIFGAATSPAYAGDFD